MEIKGKFPNGLGRLMEDKNEGPTDLAKAICTSKQNVARWRDQSRKIPNHMAKRIADHYGVDIPDVLFPEGHGDLVPDSIRKEFEQIKDSPLTSGEIEFLREQLHSYFRRRTLRNGDTPDNEPPPRD